MEHTIFIVSGGAGASGEQLVQTVLAQFPENQVRVRLVPHVRFPGQIDDLIQKARECGGIIVHTLVDPDLRRILVDAATQNEIVALDLMGPLLEQLSFLLEREPLGEPGLYRHLNRQYYERISAIDFSLAHDDGKNFTTWPQADIILVGVSRSGKTPISLYLAVLGWKVANIPLILNGDSSSISLPGDLSALDARRIIGLSIEPGQLIQLRQIRQRSLGVPGPSDYTNPDKVMVELQVARQFCRQNGFSLVEVTDKPIESSADEIIRLISSRLKLP
jgi:[pyruvate, water dikinase]-phosphate phosphotransferase / [pyruvate, water dikinase] kinase